MSNIINLYNSEKIKEADLVGENNFFRSDKEIIEFTNKQEKFISNVNYSQPENFAIFGSAEEYYKNGISYINSSYPYGGSRAEKLEWVNNLNEFEYYIFSKEYPRYAGHLTLTSSQALYVYAPDILLDDGAKETFNTLKTYFITSSLNLGTGFCFESWLKFPNTSSCDIFKINNVISSSNLSTQALFKLYTENNKFKLSASSGVYQFIYQVPENEWKHFTFNIKNTDLELYVNGVLTEKSSSLALYNSNYDYKFSKIGLLTSSLFYTLNSTGSYVAEPTFIIGSGNFINLDETRFWNEFKTVEGIGRNWFTQINGNDLTDTNNINLIFYYKFNEGTSVNDDICLDYSGFDYYGIINNYNAYTARASGSAINDSGIVQDQEIGDPIIESYITNSGTLNNYYEEKILSGSSYDNLNESALYKKFPSWILLDEQELPTKHLKQVIQIISSYFDDLYNKIGEISNYKHIQYNNEREKLYPFYNKILSSTGFDLKEIFTNLDSIEKISSRSETNVFDEDVEKVKNIIYQNLYNNLGYILKGKGTEKAIKSFLRSYGLNEKIVKINLYADKSIYTARTKSKEQVVKKKTISLSDDSNIYLYSGSLNLASDYFTFENCFYFDKKNYSNAPSSNSLFGIYDWSGADEADWANKNLEFFVTLETSNSGSCFYFKTGSSGDIISSSPLIKDIYDSSVWNTAIRAKPNLDTTNNAPATYSYIIDFIAVNYNSSITSSYSASFILPYADYQTFSNTNNIGFYTGARKNNLTGSTLVETNMKSLYVNFWNNYLSNEIITEHNKDITNYGVDE